MPAPARQPRPTACLALADGSVFYGMGFGAVGQTVAELVLNTSSATVSPTAPKPMP